MKEKIDWEAIRESIAYRSPIRKTKIIKSESFLPVATTSDEKHVGCMISGGIDSTLVLSRLNRMKRQITAYTLRWSTGTVDETDRAAEAVDFLNEENENIKHVIIDTNIEDYVKIYAEIPEFCPHARPAYYLVLKAAKENGLTKLYSGEGGDELYAGYINKYSKMLKAKNLYKYRQLAILGKFLPGRYGKYCSIIENSGAWHTYEASRSLVPDIIEAHKFKPFEKDDWISSTMTLDYEIRLLHYLETVNRMAQGIGVEIIYPILADAFKPQLWKEYWINPKHAKQPLVNELKQHHSGLNEIVTREAHGFSPPPIRLMWKHGLGDLVLDGLRDSPLLGYMGKKLNQLLKSNRFESEREERLRALTEAFTITEYLRKRGFVS
jgi:asparagine synthetase B (glutamine-hydrolysing)